MPEQFDGVVDIAQTGTLPPPPSNVPSIRVVLDGDTARVSVGGDGQGGTLVVADAAGQERVSLVFDSPDGASLELKDATGRVRLRCTAAGDIEAIDGNGTRVLEFDSQSATLEIGSPRLRKGAIGNEGDLVVRDGYGRGVLHADGATARLYVGVTGNEGDVIVRDGAGRHVFHADGATARLYLGAEGNEGDVIVRDGAGRAVIHADGASAAVYVGASGNEGDVIVRDGAGRQVIHANGNNAALYVGASGNEGDVIIRDAAGRDVIHADGDNAVIYVGANGNEGDVVVRDAAGTTRIHLDGNEGDIRLYGADCAECFELRPEAAEPGTVLVVESADVLGPCAEAYDQRVVGIVSGAGDLGPGIVLGSRADGASGAPVALAGTVYCKVDATYAAVEAGDLLTTSPTAGFAMKATDPARSQGAVLGKALAGRASGRGLIPVVVTLQ